MERVIGCRVFVVGLFEDLLLMLEDIGLLAAVSRESSVFSTCIS
jgi:hypothetical protein